MTLKDAALGLLALAVAVLLMERCVPQPAPVGAHLEAPPAPQVAKVERVAVPVAPVQALAPAAKRKLKLPAPVQADPGKHVVAATRTPADERAHTVTTVLDAATGEVATYQRAEPLPWLAPQSRTEVGAAYGLRGMDPALRVEARHELLQIKRLHLGATASADVMAGEVDTFVGVGVWARW